ncbi:MAG TPA: FHA domain-containing protein [Polyangiaceae bacterium]|jgi:hypothetical protein|nr:FHA domain-containing protein [Polyangiaceae bacterium]
MPYELGALIDSTRTITVHSATPSDGPVPRDTLSALALRQIVARDQVRAHAFRELSTALQHVRYAALLPVVDLVESDGRPVAVAALPTGAPLSRLIVAPRRRAARFGLAPSVRLVLDTARAAHVLHIARPDLRPLGYLSADTVWVTVEGRAVLLPSARSAPVGAGVRGKPASWGRYRAPECDEHGVHDESADVYSLAVLLWDLLAAGRPQPTSESVDATSENPVWIDPDVVRLVMRSLSTDVSVRPRDPGAFAAELLRIVTRLDPSMLPPLAADDEAKTIPGFVSSYVSPSGPVEPVTVELPEAAREPGSARFAVVAPKVRVAAEPAVYAVGARPPIPRPAFAGRPTSRRSPKLRLVEPAEQGAVSELRLTNEPRRWVIGRAPSAHLVVADPDMSREHFAIFWEGEGRYRVHDLGSKNGLFVNGKATTDLPLTPGDEVRAGATRLRFEA